MSDSDNELGSLAPTTPLVPLRKRSRPAESRAVAGPSKPGRARAKNVNQVADIVGTADVIPVDTLSDEIIELAPPTRGSRTSVRSESVVGSGRPTTKGKEKAMATAPQPTRTSRRVAQTNEAAIISDDNEHVEQTDIEQPDRHAINGTKASVVRKKPAAPSRSAANADITSKELERLRARLSEAETQRDAFSEQLEELFRLRHTDVEKLLEEKTAQYDTRIQAQDALIDQLTAQAARTEPLTRSGKGSVLHLVTREAADEEKKMIERDLAKWKALAKEKDEINEQRSKEITELQRSVDDLRMELQAEIERNRQLVVAQKAVQSSRSHTHGSVLGVDPKNEQLVKLYEDLTNFLVSSFRFMPVKDGKEEIHMVCHYTHVDPNAAALAESIPDEGRTLPFTLRFYRDAPADANPVNQDTDRVLYTPQITGNESAEFIERLEFLASPFTFERQQLPMFFSTLQKNTSPPEQGTQDPDEDGEMEVEEV